MAKGDYFEASWPSYLIGENFTNQNMIEQLPKSLQDAIAKPSAPEEVNRTSMSDLNLTQMIALLALPESETQAFIEQKAAEGTPVEDMTVKTLRQEVKAWKEKAETAERERDEADNEVLRQSNKELT